jgi:hypothetical protein
MQSANYSIDDLYRSPREAAPVGERASVLSRRVDTSALKLQERGRVGPEGAYRLVGSGLSKFQKAEKIGPQLALFE